MVCLFHSGKEGGAENRCKAHRSGERGELGRAAKAVEAGLRDRRCCVGQGVGWYGGNCGTRG